MFLCAASTYVGATPVMSPPYRLLVALEGLDDCIQITVEGGEARAQIRYELTERLDLIRTSGPVSLL